MIQTRAQDLSTYIRRLTNICSSSAKVPSCFQEHGWAHKHMYILTDTCKHTDKWSWEDDSLRTLVFIEFALNRGPRFCSQCPPGGSQTSITQVPGSPISSSALDIKHTHFCAVKTSMHVIIIFKKQFRKLIEILNSQLYLGLYFRLWSFTCVNKGFAANTLVFSYLKCTFHLWPLGAKALTISEISIYC